MAIEPPDCSDASLVEAVRGHFDLLLKTLTFLPLGQDPLAWTFRATTTDETAYFIKLHRGAVSQAGLAVPRYLAGLGVSCAVAPLRARDQRLWAELDGLTLTLYPFINASTGMEHGLEEHHWVAYGAALRAIHRTPVEPELRPLLTREPFTTTAESTWPGVSRWSDVVTAAEAAIQWRNVTDPIQDEVARFWQAQRALIQALIERFEALGRELRGRRPALVLCHSDIHPNNLLIDTEDHLWIVDWEDTLLAPKECDLIFGLGGLGNYPAGPREQAWFLRGYGETTVDPVALTFYRCLRAIGDIGWNAEQLLLMPAVGEATKRNALERMKMLFEPGFMVSMAGGSGQIPT
jgi:spectinomycin phosphotransferase